jgi:hypothetical protein
VHSATWSGGRRGLGAAKINNSSLNYSLYPIKYKFIDFLKILGKFVKVVTDLRGI